MVYFRLSQQSNILPLHWSYLEAWQWCHVRGIWIDNRQSGFQVWENLASLIATAAGCDTGDGQYPASEYPFCLIIEASEDFVSDGIGEWYAIEPEGVESVKVISTEQLVEKAYKLYEEQKEQYDYDDFISWLQDSTEELYDWIKENSTYVRPKFIETLPLQNPIKISVD